MTPDPSLPLAPTIADLGDAPRRTFDQLREAGIRAVQLNAAQSGLKPRDLDQSGRRDLLATLRRKELILSGIDLWIPAGHFLDPAHVDRAVGATFAAIELAADLNRCPLSVVLPIAPDVADAEADSAEAILQSLGEFALRHGVMLVDHALPVASREAFGLGIDPAAWLAKSLEPDQGVLEHATRLASARLVDLLSTGLRGPIGNPREGRLDVMAYLASLSVVGYSKPVVLDTRQFSEPWAAVILSKDAWDAAARLS